MDRWNLTADRWCGSLWGDRVWSMQKKSGGQDGVVLCV